MGCWLSNKIEQKTSQRHQPKSIVVQASPVSHELPKQNIPNIKDEAVNEQLKVSQPIVEQVIMVKADKERRKSHLGNLLAQSKTINVENRFTKKPKQHIAFISPEEKPMSQQNAIKIILQGKLDSVRQFIEENGQSLTSCSLCTLSYDLLDRQPKMICMNQHTLCAECVDELWSKGIKKCPFDKREFDIKNVKKNRIIIQFMQQQQKIKQKQL